MPLLSTLGAGSARGFGGIGSTQSRAVESIDKYGEFPTEPTSATLVMSTGSALGWTAGYLAQTALISPNNSTPSSDAMIVTASNTNSKPVIWTLNGVSNWADVTTASDVSDDTSMNAGASSSGTGTIGESLYSDTSSHYCFSERCYYNRENGSGDPSTEQVLVAGANQTYTNPTFSMDPTSQRFGQQMDGVYPFVARSSKDQSGVTFGGTGQLNMHMFQDINGTNSKEYFFNNTANTDNTHGVSARGVFLGATTTGNTTTANYFESKFEWSTGAKSSYSVYTFDKDNSSSAVSSFGSVTQNGPNLTDGDGADWTPENSGGYWVRSQSKYPYCFFYGSENSGAETFYFSSLANGISDSAADVRIIDTSNKYKGSCVIHNDGTDLHLLYHQSGALRKVKFNPTTRQFSNDTSLLNTGAGVNEILGIRPIPGTNRVALLSTYHFELIEIY